MAWVRLDDQAPRNRKMLRAGPAACWLWVCGIAHCQSQLTEGFIADEALGMIGVTGVGRCKTLAEVLVNVGLFHRTEGGYTIHDYLAFNDSKEEATARKDAQREQRRQAGIASGVSRQRKPNEPVQRPVEPPLNPIPSHPIRSLPEERTNTARVRETVSLIPDKDSTDAGERAAWFVERYSALYPEHRNGARFLPKPALDWTAACELVQVWPSDRLEKLAIVFLKTDHEFATNGSRTIRQFAALASWCDDRLRQVETERGR